MQGDNAGDFNHIPPRGCWTGGQFCADLSASTTRQSRPRRPDISAPCASIIQRHRPGTIRTTFFRRGTTIAHPESAERYHVLRKSTVDAGFEIHDADRSRARADPGGALGRLRGLPLERLEPPRRDRRPGGRAADDAVRAPADASSPGRPARPARLLHRGHVDAACAPEPGAPSTALRRRRSRAADAALEHGVAYALCRPPGHHAFADCAGGFCYVNNTAVAAQRLRTATGQRVAILDIDVHHGNGTQGIFYQRDDVLTISIHADPSNYFPFYAGYAEETGAGAGLGFNVNLPLAHGSGDAAFLRGARSRARAHSRVRPRPRSSSRSVSTPRSTIRSAF